MSTSKPRVLLQLLADDFWKRKSYSTAASSLEDHPEAIKSAKQALKLKGVGKGCAALVRSIAGHSSEAHGNQPLLHCGNHADGCYTCV